MQFCATVLMFAVHHSSPVRTKFLLTFGELFLYMSNILGRSRSRIVTFRCLREGH